MNDKRIEWIDVTKGVSIMLVVIGHVTSSYHAAGLYQSSLVLNFSNQYIYSFHMATFMFISGLLFKNKRNKISQIKRILLSYGIPYLVFSCVWWAFKMVLSQYVNSELSIQDLLMIPICPISFMWFIYALMFMEIVQVIIGDLSRKKKILQLAFGLFLYYLAPLVSEIQIPGTSYRFSDFVISDIMAFYCYFIVGVCFGKEFVSLIKKHKQEIIIGGGTALLLSNILIYQHDVSCASGIKMLLAFCGVGFLIAVCVEKRNRVLSFIGKRTLPVYVLHGLCIAAIRVVLERIGLRDSSGIIPLVICSVLGTAIPLGIYEISRKVWHLDFFFAPGKYIKI